MVHLLTSAHATISISATSLSPRARHEPTKDVPTSLRELQLSPPLFQQTPRFHALDGKPIHLSLEKLTCCHALQREPSDGLVDQTILRYPSPRISAPLKWARGRQLGLRRPDELMLQSYASVRLNIAFDLVLQLAVRARRQGAHDRIDAGSRSRLEKSSLKLH